MDILDMPILILGDLGNGFEPPVGSKPILSFLVAPFLPTISFSISISSKSVFVGLEAVLRAVLTYFTLTVHHGIHFLHTHTTHIHNSQVLLNYYYYVTHHAHLLGDSIVHRAQHLLTAVLTLHGKPLLLSYPSRAFSTLLSTYYTYVHPTLTSALGTAHGRLAADHLRECSDDIWLFFATAWVFVAACYAYKLYRFVRTGFDGRARISVHGVDDGRWRVLCGFGRVYVGVPTRIFGCVVCGLGDVVLPGGRRIEGGGGGEGEGGGGGENRDQARRFEEERRRWVLMVRVFKTLCRPCLSVLSLASVFVLVGRRILPQTSSSSSSLPLSHLSTSILALSVVVGISKIILLISAACLGAALACAVYYVLQLAVFLSGLGGDDRWYRSFVVGHDRVFTVFGFTHTLTRTTQT